MNAFVSSVMLTSRHLGHERIGEEEELKQGRRGRLEQLRASTPALAQHAPKSNEQDEQREGKWRDHVYDEGGDVAAHVEALEQGADAVEAEADAH